MIRATLVASVLFSCAGDAIAQQARNVRGAWSGETSPSQEYPPYFAATLTQRGQTLTGTGHVNRCPACRGFDQYEVRWTGSIKGDVVLLIARHVDRPWESEQHYEGLLSEDGRRIVGTYRDGRESEPFVMERGANRRAPH